MQNKKTILKELLEWIDSSDGRMLEDPWWEIQVKIQSLLSEEKEQIEKFSIDCIHNLIDNYTVWNVDDGTWMEDDTRRAYRTEALVKAYYKQTYEN